MATVWQPDPLSTQQIGGCTGILRGAPAKRISGNQPLTNQASRCSSVRSSALPLPQKCVGEDGFANDGRRQEQEHLWQQFFLDPAMWWDNRGDRKSSRSPHFRRKGSGEVLWLNNMFKPAWVNEQLVSLDMEMGHGAPPAKASSPDNRPGRRPGSEMGVVTAETVSRLCQQGKLSEAVGALESLSQTNYAIPQSLFYTVLKLCTAKKDLVVGRRVHDLTVRGGYESSTYLGNHILRMYASGGRLEEAMDVFTRVSKPDVFMWSSIISAYGKHGKPTEAVELYHEMSRSGVKADAHVFVAALQACAFAADLTSGRKVHCDVVQSGIPPDLFVCNCLVDMYAKCGEVKDARQVFDSMATKDVVTWNALISGYAKCGELNDARRLFDSMNTKNVVTWNALIAGYVQQGLGHDALVLYGQMEQEGLILANHVTFACLSKACASTGALQKGRQLHLQIVERGLLDNELLGTCLADMYTKCGALEDARQVFEPGKRAGLEMGVVTAGTVSMLCQEGKLSEAFGALESLAQTDSAIPQSLFYHVLKLCAVKKDLVVGRQVHDLTVKFGYDSDAYVGNHILRMYASGGCLQEAMDVFTRVGKPDAFMWFSIISAYAKHGKPKEAIQLYHEMCKSGVKADAHVFVAVLQACAFAADLESGREVHCDLVQSGVPPDLFVGNCLVDMYAKCGELKDARQVFDNMATKDVVTWNALISGYAKCGELRDAHQVFDSMKTRNVVTWNALIGGYAEQGLGHEALVLYGQMEQEGLILANHVTFACLLKACASSSALQKGKQLHLQIVERGLLDNVVLGTCLVEMYAKCGELEDARQVFDSMKTKDVVTWTALIAGYGTCDEGHKALACFEEMLGAGIQPNDATFTCLLVACSHAGLVHDGRKHFDSMADQHGIKPTIEHYACMIDLLGRAGHVDEAEKMLLSCEGQSDVVGLRSLLNACLMHGDIERAVWCFDSIVRLDPEDASSYMLMAKAYADAGRWTDVDRIETQRRAAGASKKPAVATIEVNTQVHRFLVGERREDIALKVESTNARLKQEGGHVPHTKLVLQPLSEKEKEDALCGHAEKLALAFGLLNTPSGTPLVVTKNLRMCSDCHSSTEVMSRLEQRDIVVRDGYRVHRFADGCCSCNGRP